MNSRWKLAALALLSGLGACGGGGGSAGDSGALQSSATYAQQCAPTNTLADSSLRTGSLDIEKRWVRSYMDEAYLWYDQVPTINAALSTYSNTADVYTSLDNYFHDLRTPNLTPSGKRVDQFSFTYSTADWNALSQSGADYGYGINWVMLAAYPPRDVRVATVVPGSAADLAGIQRGDVLQTVDGQSIVYGSDVTALNAGTFPTVAGQVHSFSLLRNGVTLINASLTSASVVSPPVPLVKTISTATGTVGYIVFDAHVVPAEAALIDAVNQLKAANITDLVLDLRYNGGGYLYIASELAYMIAGAPATNGKIFEKLAYNNKRASDNAKPATPFYSISCIPDASFNCTSQQPLPTLGLSRVYVLTGAGTCSASESVINSLRGIDVTVYIVGGTTCSKPYGFTAKDNCGISYFPIESKGTNNKGYGDYADGFAPSCGAVDDFSHALGDIHEGQLSTALNYRAGVGCFATASAGQQHALAADALPRPVPLRSPAHDNRILQPLHR